MAAPTRTLWKHNLEFAYNTDTTSANNTSSFHSDDGTAGAVVPNRTVGTAASKRCRFKSGLTAYSKITIEWKRPVGGSQWSDLNSVGVFLRQGANAYGISWDNDATGNDIDVTFNAGGLVASNATYAGNGADFATLNAAGYKWRARKEG